MDLNEIYRLASEITEKQVDTLLNHWQQTEENESVNLFNSLVKLGDSKQLAMATCILERYEKSKLADLHRLELEHEL